MVLKRSAFALAVATSLSTCVYAPPEECDDTGMHRCYLPDASRPSDGSPDVPNDSARDAEAPRDAGGACDASDPCWVRIEGLPSECDIWRAVHPERIRMPAFNSCGTGCERADWRLTWTSTQEVGSVGTDGVAYLQAFGSDVSAGLYPVGLLMRDDGEVVFAVRYPLNGETASGGICWAFVMGARDGYASFDVYHGVGPDLTPAEDYVYYAPLAEIATVQSPTRVLSVAGDNAVERLDVSDRGVVWELTNGDGQGVLDGAFIELDVGGGVHRPRLVGGSVLWVDFLGRIHLRAPSAAESTLIDFSPRIADGGALTDGEHIAWFEFIDQSSSTSTLRVGPFTEDAASFTARTLEGPGLPALTGVLGEGLVAHDDFVPGAPVTWNGIRVVDVATGDAHLWTAPPTERSGFLYFVTRDALVFETQSASGSTLWRVVPDQLPLAPAVTLLPG